jgi:hypothetical protein
VERASVQIVRRAARDVFRTEQAANAWLTVRSRHLGTTPLACTVAGHGDLVLAILRLVARNEEPETRFSPTARTLGARVRALLAGLWPRRWRRARPVRLPVLSATEPRSAPRCRSTPRAPR